VPRHSPLDRIDPIHARIGFQNQELSYDVWNGKYRAVGDTCIEDTFRRVANAIMPADEQNEAYEFMVAGLFMPAGRILAGAGTQKRVTLMNCYVSPTIADSLITQVDHEETGVGIMDALSIAAQTQQMGGGIGMDFSPIRPAGAVVRRTNSVSSGILPFMDMWDAMCSTIRSAGDRRGAMMGTLIDSHPDLPAFIKAKHTQGRLTNFNVSILVSDAFMQAVKDDEEWFLYFNVPPAKRDPKLERHDFRGENTERQYVYEIWRARELWDLIIRSTYEYAEPGVIFIDRVNELNNLNYCEEIRCTNPCGEQPLPPNGTCNLGAINLSRIVKEPFTGKASIDWELLKDTVSLGVRFLDRVIDVTAYPTGAQEAEEKAKRRIGLGITGLGDMIAQLVIDYDTLTARQVASQVMETIARTAYATSTHLGLTHGSFPLYNPLGFAEQSFPKKVGKGEVAMRNGVLLTVAPTGTTSVAYGNISSGLEPIFSHQQVRYVRQHDGSYKESGVTFGYTFQMLKALGMENHAALVRTALELPVRAHVLMQGAIQEWVDASVSKTINCPEHMTYEAFREVYTMAYENGCKGCTTYRPSGVRGSVLVDAERQDKPKSDVDESVPQVEKLTETINGIQLPIRPDTLEGKTYKLKWPSMSAAIYVTINHLPDGQPFEVFFASKDARHQEWMTALSVLISAIFRQGTAPDFLISELKSIQSTTDMQFWRQKLYPSLVAAIGAILEDHFHDRPTSILRINEGPSIQLMPKGESCPQCGMPTLVRKEGCKQCTSCGYSACS
jgi:ribonucleoside-diphosphate reductase alpha chain